MPDAATSFPVTDDAANRKAARRKRARARARKTELSLTSMIDVIFLLLIFFMVTASFMINEGVLHALPQGPSPDPSPLQVTTPVDIELSSAGPEGTQVQIAVEGLTFASFSELHAYLDDQLHAPELGRQDGIYPIDNPMIIRPDAEVRWQHAVAAFNALVRAQYESVQFAQPATAP